MLPGSASSSIALVSFIPAVVIVFYLIYSLNWSAFRAHSGVQNFFIGSIFVASGFWAMHAGVRPGLGFHILAATAMTLLMGWRFALLSLAIVLAVMVVFGRIHWQEWALSFLIGAAIPVFACYQFYLHVFHRLPKNPFVYILVGGFLNAGFTQAVYALAVSIWYWWAGDYTWTVIWEDYLRYLPLMMFPEGVINGMFIAGMVSFHPRWLSTFDEDSYFN